MGELAQVYDDVRTQLSALARDLSENDVVRPVPATPGWRVRDVIAHLAADATCVINGDFPIEFFQAFGDDSAVVGLNRWTSQHVSSRANEPISNVIAEWERSSDTLTRMMRGEIPWPQDIPPFADRVLLTDLGVHQHDIYGALGLVRERDGTPVRIGSSGYMAMIDWRVRSDGAPTLEVVTPDRTWRAGDGDPAAVLRCDRFELFRALSGRRSPEQIRAYDWTGDPEPFVRYFYPYGVRAEPLVE